MSNLKAPKFGIGDVVWTACVSEEDVQAECPDCHDTKLWTASSPAGESFPFPCPRCQGRESKLRHRKAVFSLRQLTIGSVRINTEDDDPVSYMCAETGVGSGTIWREGLLSVHEECAKQVGRLMVAEREAWRASEIERMEHGQGAAVTAGRLEVALRYHTFTTAEITAARSKQWRADYELGNLCNAIAELDEGSIDGLDSAMNERVVNELARTCDAVRACREAVLYDRENARKNAA